MEGSSIYHEKLDINITRKVYDENCLTATRRHSRSEESSNKNHYLRTVYRKLASCRCSWHGVFSFLFRLAPILRWLPKYNMKKDLSADITGGVTVGIMHIPQGNILNHLLIYK